MERLKRYSIFYIPLLYLIVALLLDMVMYLFMGLPFATKYFYSLALMVIVAALVCLTQRKWLQITILSVLIGLQTVTCIANVLCYRNLNEIFSWESISSIVNAAIASKSSRPQIGFLFAILAVVAIYVVGVILIARFFKTPLAKKPLWQPIACGVLAVVFLLGNLINYATLPKYQDTYIQNLSNDKFVYDTFLNRIENLQTFGSYSYYLNNVMYLLHWKKNATEALSIAVEPEFQPDATDYDQVPAMQVGDNLIMILMETFERAAIHPLIMPNLYQFLTNSCIDVQGYYALERTCTTDYISQTGMHVLGKEMWSSYGDVEIPFSLGHLFQNEGYTTNAFHNNKGSYYGRAKMFTQSLGFDHFYDYKSLSHQYKKYFNANKDYDLLTENLTRIAPADRDFYSYIISISTHGISSVIDLRGDYPDEFQYLDQLLANDYATITKAFPWLTATDVAKKRTIMNYLAGAINFDKGFGELLTYLAETDDLTAPGKKLIETTAIMMFGDHYYYMTPGSINTDEDDPSLIGNKSPFIIYHPHAATGRTINRFTTTMDIYKTVCSMFGVVTDQQLTMGHTVFGNTPSIGIGYLNGYIWGENANGTHWRTSDFITFAGSKPDPDALLTQLQHANDTFDTIIANMSLYRTNGFKTLPKAQQYRLNTYQPK